mgnify:CR=1 FL=1
MKLEDNEEVLVIGILFGIGVTVVVLELLFC